MTEEIFKDLHERISIENSNIKKITIRPEEHKDYKNIISLILRSFQEGTDYSDGTDIIALVEEIRDSKYYIPELSFVAELDNEVVGHFWFSHFSLSPTREGGHDDNQTSEIVMLAPVSVHADYFHQGIGSAMLKMGIEKVKEMGYKGITVEGNFNFYNKVGFKTSSEYNIFPTSGWPMEEPRCMMCQETYKRSFDGIHGYIVYNMYSKNTTEDERIKFYGIPERKISNLIQQGIQHSKMTDGVQTLELPGTIIAIPCFQINVFRL